MPEFDEDTYKQKNRNNQELSYEPGKHADKYKSTQPGLQKKNQTESSKAASIWVEAAMDTPHKMPKPERKKSGRRSDRNYSGKKGKPGNRRRPNRRRKPSLWQRILRFLGLAPKRKNRKFDGKKGQNSRRPQQKGNSRNQGNRQRQDQNRPQGGKPGDERPRGEGEGRKRRRRRSRRPNQGAEAGNKENANKAENQAPKRDEQQQDRRSERGGPRPERGERRQQRPRDRERNRDREPRRENREPKPNGPSPKLESVAAPKTEDLTLGAVDLGGSSSKSETEAPKFSAPRGKRNRRASGKPQAAASSGSDFVPHPIELPGKSEKSESDS